MANDEPQAYVESKDGQLILHDPAAEGVMMAVAAHNRAVGKENCRLVYEDPEQQERIKHFANRIAERGLDPNEVVIVLISVDDVHGRPLADHLMPGMDQTWQGFRDKGQKPFARGIVIRKEMEETLSYIDKVAGERLKSFDGIAVVVVDSGTGDVFSVN